jgi:hypothetical protein
MRTCATSTARTVVVLAPISPPRDSGVEPSRLSTPYRRSKPVAMAWLVKAVDSTASAITPGTRKSTRDCWPEPTLTRSPRLNAVSSSTGMISVSSSCSPLRSSVLASSVACAAIIRGIGAAPGAGAGQSVRPAAGAPPLMAAAPAR